MSKERFKFAKADTKKKGKKSSKKNRLTVQQTLSHDILSGKMKFGSKEYWKAEGKQVGTTSLKMTASIALVSLTSHGIAAIAHHVDSKNKRK